MSDLLLQLAALANLESAWERVRDNRGCAGADGISISDFQSSLKDNLALLARELINETYRPLPLMRILVDKGNGESRSLSIPTVRDRIAQAAALNILEPIFEAEFEPCSFAYRKGRSWRQAVHAVVEYYNQGYCWALDADIDAFFDSVPHDLLLKKIDKLMPDKRMQYLVSLWVKTRIWDGEAVCQLKLGIPQGSVISPILANLYLDELDEALQRQGIKIVRYADDFLVLCKTREKAQKALQLTDEILEKMSLRLDEADIIHFNQGFRFLGVIFCRSVVMVPFEAEKKQKRVLYMPPLLPLRAYEQGLLPVR